MAQRPGPPIAITYVSLSAFTRAVSEPSSTFAGVTNDEVLQQAEIARIEAILLKYQLRWAGNTSIIEDNRLPMIALYSELSTGHRDGGAPKKRYKDCHKNSLTELHVDLFAGLCWSDVPADRDS